MVKRTMGSKKVSITSEENVLDDPDGVGQCVPRATTLVDNDGRSHAHTPTLVMGVIAYVCFM